MSIEIVYNDFKEVTDVVSKKEYTEQQIKDITSIFKVLSNLKDCVGEKALHVLAMFIEEYPEEVSMLMRELSSEYSTKAKENERDRVL